MTIQNMRTGLANNLSTISGLRTSVDVPDQINVPMAVISLTSITYDQAFAGGMTEYNFTVTAFVGRASERTAQRKLDGYAFTDANGFKEAIESDRTLNGSAFDCRVTDMSNVSAVSLGEVEYLTCDFRVTVIAN